MEWSSIHGRSIQRGKTKSQLSPISVLYPLSELTTNERKKKGGITEIEADVAENCAYDSEMGITEISESLVTASSTSIKEDRC